MSSNVLPFRPPVPPRQEPTSAELEKYRRELQQLSYKLVRSLEELRRIMHTGP